MTTVVSNTPAAGAPARSGRRGLRVLSTIVLTLVGAALVVGVVYLTPAPLGGPASYVVTQGTSMLPAYEPGGVVITRERDDYVVGDVVAYRNADLGGTVVMHRIIGTDHDRLVLQGDNNDFVDDYHPSTDQVVGEAWVYLPGAGEAVQKLREPIVFGVLIASLTLLSVRAPRATSRRRRRHHGD